MRTTPFDRIQKNLSGMLPLDCLKVLPKKWEKIGTVVVLKLPLELTQYQEMIGKVYADELGCSSALNDVGGISGVYRIPVVKVIWGSPRTETIHKENEVRYMLDPQKVYVAGTLIDFVPDMMVSVIRREAIPRLCPSFGGVDIQPLLSLQEFEFKGAFGLVLFNGFRTLNRDINAKLITPWSSEDRVGAVNRIGSGV